MKTYKIVIISISAVVLALGGILIYRYMRNKNKGEGEPEIPVIPESISNTVSTISNVVTGRNDNFPLKSGSLGNNVRTLQTALNKKGATLTVDGDFGAKTAAALSKYGYATTVDATLFATITGTGATTLKVGDTVKTTKNTTVSNIDFSTKITVPANTVIGQIQKIGPDYYLIVYKNMQGYILKNSVTKI